jgi:hypothetical protein
MSEVGVVRKRRSRSEVEALVSYPSEQRTLFLRRV